MDETIFKQWVQIKVQFRTVVCTTHIRKALSKLLSVARCGWSTACPITSQHDLGTVSIIYVLPDYT